MMFLPMTFVALFFAAVSAASEPHETDFVPDAYAVRRWTADDGLPGNHVTALAETPDGFLAVTTTDGTVFFDGVRFFAPDPAAAAPSSGARAESGLPVWADNRGTCRLAEPGGIVWIGTDGDGLLRIRPRVIAPPALPRDRSGHVLFRDSSGRVWSVNGGDGVCCVAPDGTRSQYGTAEGFHAKDVTSFAETPDGGIWVGSGESGLWRITGTETARFHYGDDGASDVVRALFCDSEGTLWVCGRGDAVTCISDGTSKTVRLGYLADGTEAVFHEEPMGRMWLAGGDQVLSFLTADFKSPSAGSGETLPVDVFKASAAEKPPRVTVDVPRVSRLTFRRSDDVSFSCSAGSPGLADVTRFSSRLPPLENDWSEDTADRTRAFGRLAPGKYRFEVRARWPGGTWGEAVSVAFTVAPAFYETTPFIAGGALVLLLAVFVAARAVYLRRVHQRLAAIRHRNILALERARIARDIHDDVGARLTRISMLISMMAERNGEAYEIADEVRDVVRALDEVVWAVEPRNDTLSSFVDYVYNYAETFVASAKLGLRADLPSETPDAKIPSVVRHAVYMCVKEALNNVVKHAEASRVFVSMKLADGRVTLAVGDDGKGFAAPRDGGNGLLNMRARMESIGGTFTAGPRDGGGCETVFGFELEGKGG